MLNYSLNIFLVLFRYIVVQVILWVSQSQMECLIGAVLLSFFLTLSCLWHALRLLDVYVETASLDFTE